DAGPAFVPRDRREPGGRLPGLGSAQERAVRREERLLRRVLGLGTIAQERAAETSDGAAVLGEEQLGPCSGRTVAGAAVRLERFVRRAGQSSPPPSPLSLPPWSSSP